MPNKPPLQPSPNAHTHMAISLPIDSILPGLLSGLRDHPSAVIVAEPGAGKSTRVPPAVAACCNGQVFVLQPRRVAARAVAERIAEEGGWKPGGYVGYRIRFENKTSAATRIVIMTEGILARIIQKDPFLDGVSAVIIDEFHERNLNTDIALALTREIQATVRPDLQIIVMSATLDPGPVSAFLSQAPIWDAPGRTFPLDIQHAKQYDTRPLEARAAETVAEACHRPNSAAPHVLVFLPGMAEIRRTADALPASLRSAVHLLHSSVPAEAQHAALAPATSRKIILATNIAETSLTIDGVGLVIDSGLARVPVHDTRLGLDRLEVRRISRASAMQRAGRAGRSGPGTCIRLYTAEEHAAMEAFDIPEILRLDLAGVLLMLKAYGISNAGEFGWFERPSGASLDRAMRLLTMLDAIDGNAHLTDWGRAISDLPLHPRLASVFLHGVRAGFGRETAWLCALLEAGDTSPAGGRRPEVRESDPLDRLHEILSNQSGAPWAVRSAAAQLERLARDIPRTIPSATVDRDVVLRQALLRGFPDRLVRRRVTGDARGIMVGQRGVRLAPQSGVNSAMLYVAVDLRERLQDTESLVQSASAIDEAWLPELLPDLWKQEDTVRIQKDKVEGVRRRTFADLIIDEKELGRVPTGVDMGAIINARLLAKFGSPLRCLLSVDAVQAWLSRYLFLQAHMTESDLPAPDYDAALAAACGACRTINDFPAQALTYLQAMLPQSATRMIDDNAPEHLVLPSGNRVRISFPAIDVESGTVDAGGQPSAAARVQELFGLAESPRLAAGRVPLVIELLSPAMRPVQKTRDLKSFWNGTYQEVRKELRARYPKHPWPEDPWTALPVSIGRRRK